MGHRRNLSVTLRFSCTSAWWLMLVNIMELCKAYELPVEGTCGGMAMCASCQCYVNDVTLPEMGEDEEAMLSEAFYVKANSRLGCQIPITENLEGLELELALKVNKSEN
jgi:2Fe-2S ferredoxin